MEMLLNSLRDYWSVDVEKVDNWVSVDCNAMLNSTLRYLDGGIESSQGVITHNPLPNVVAEEYLLTLLFQNLVGNALKYRKDETPRIHISSTLNGKQWILSVSDNGIGIDAKDADVIFAPFKRLNGNKYPGSGLGLAMCQKIVERYNGKIWVESVLGVGSTFRFTLPSEK